MIAGRNAIAFFSDRTSLPGLHVALLSLARSNRDLDVDVFVFLDAVGDHERSLLERTWVSGDAVGRLVVRHYSPRALANSLHGNATAYGRIYLGELLPDHERCVYLDCDVVVNVGLEPIFEALDGDVVLAADCVQIRRESNDVPLFVLAGRDLDAPYFNSGVLGLRLDRWRSEHVLERCRSVAGQYPEKFRSADQSLLNVVFDAGVFPLGATFNTRLYAASPRPDPLQQRIYHFVGSPKPWDPLGTRLHSSHAVWADLYAATAAGDRSTSRYFSLRRMIYTAKQSAKAWFARRLR